MDGSKPKDDYMMYEFKIVPCSRADHHNWKHCPHRHPGEVAAQRRHPSVHKPAFCMNLKLYGSCAAGDDCPFSHNTFEMSLHPERYKTTLCNLGEKCNREICFFAHSSEDLRTPDLSTPLLTNHHHQEVAAAPPGAGALAPSAAGAAGSPLLMQQQQPQQQDVQHLLQQAEQQLQFDSTMQQQQLAGQQEQHALLLSQVQAQQQQAQQAAQANELALARHQLLMAHAANQGLPRPAAGGAAGAGRLPVLAVQDVVVGGGSHMGGSFTSQCSSASYMSGMGALRAAPVLPPGSLPVSPLLDRSAQSFTFTDRSGGSFSTLGSAMDNRPHSFTVGDRPPPGVLLTAGLGERPPSFTVADLGSRPSSFTLPGPGGQLEASPAGSCAPPFAVERSAASYPTLLERAAAGPPLLDGGGLAVVERSCSTQRSFTLGQRPQLAHQAAAGMAWYQGQAGHAGLAAAALQLDAHAAAAAAAAQQQQQQALYSLGPAQGQQQEQAKHGLLGGLW